MSMATLRPRIQRLLAGVDKEFMEERAILIDSLLYSCVSVEDSVSGQPILRSCWPGCVEGPKPEEDPSCLYDLHALRGFIVSVYPGVALLLGDGAAWESGAVQKAMRDRSSYLYGVTPGDWYKAWGALQHLFVHYRSVEFSRDAWIHTSTFTTYIGPFEGAR